MRAQRRRRRRRGRGRGRTIIVDLVQVFEGAAATATEIMRAHLQLTATRVVKR
jgi:hypothetical protein